MKNLIALSACAATLALALPAYAVTIGTGLTTKPSTPVVLVIKPTHAAPGMAQAAAVTGPKVKPMTGVKNPAVKTGNGH